MHRTSQTDGGEYGIRHGQSGTQAGPDSLPAQPDDVEHRMWYCRMKMPKADRYKTVSLKTTDIDVARDRAFHQERQTSDSA